MVGSSVPAPDLTAGAALVVVAIMALGDIEIYELSHIDRGYEKFTEKLIGLGVCVSRVPCEPDLIKTAGGLNDA